MIKVNAVSETGRCVEVPLERSTFPGGEEHVRARITGLVAPRQLRIWAMLTSSAEVMALMLVTDALRRAFPDCPITLEMPYIPYARQDRVCRSGEALGIRVFCDLLNAQEYDAVYVTDPHSDVATALLNKVTSRPISDSLRKVVTAIPGVVLVAPDAGARKRVSELARSLGGLPVIHADKARDLTTGEVTGVQVDISEVDGRPLLVVDDICDGGRTFIELGTALAGAGVPLYLYVTHGIFSRGVEALLPIYDTIFTRFDWTDCGSDRVKLI